MSKGQVSQGPLAGIAVFTAVVVLGATTGWSQELGGAGTVQGTVKDPTGGVMTAVTVELSNPVTGFRRSATTDASGRFVFRNLPPNSYHVSIVAQGFAPYAKDVDVRSAVPIDVDVTLALAGATATVDVVGHAEDLVERDPTAHTDIDQSLIAKLPMESVVGAESGRSRSRRRASSSDSNGFFHPIGDHAQTQFSIDNQPVTDQQSRVYSNQISPDAVQSMEVITGVAPAEYGDKSSLVVHIVTKSGLDQPKPTGSVVRHFGSFKQPGVRGQHRRRLAHGRRTSCRSAGCGPTGSSIRRSSTRCTTTATACRSSTGWTPTPAHRARST